MSGYCEASGIAEREVFEAALAQYLDSTNDMSLVLRRLDRLGRAGVRAHRELEILSETFAVFMRLWFAHTPSLTEEEKPAARKDAESRYGQFVEHIGERFAGGHRFLDDLPREVVANDAELDAISIGASSSGDGDSEKKRSTVSATANSLP
ncbi:MAG TPA: hypothetical protein VNZ26_05450 [Vicinamibacterales bacterium]|nr:hypothetical protein [Vicinamibacterales bacterium]